MTHFAQVLNSALVNKIAAEQAKLAQNREKCACRSGRSCGTCAGLVEGIRNLQAVLYKERYAHESTR